MDADVSSRISNCEFVSPRYFFKKHLSVRAKTFQSTCRRSSPSEYARYSANCCENPKSGERWSPATNPSTTVFATRSRPEMEASVAGSRNRCSIKPSPSPRRRGDAETSAEKNLEVRRHHLRLA